MVRIRDRLSKEAEIVSEFLKQKGGEVKLQEIMEHTKETINWGNKKSVTNRMTTIVNYLTHECGSL